jgi:hypothetical protein
MDILCPLPGIYFVKTRAETNPPQRAGRADAHQRSIKREERDVLAFGGGAFNKSQWEDPIGSGALIMTYRSDLLLSLQRQGLWVH